MPSNARCSWQAGGVAAAAGVCLIRLQLNAIRYPTPGSEDGPRQ
jgi:hypothetical protein